MHSLLWVPSPKTGVPSGWGHPQEGLDFFGPAPRQYALGMDPEDLLDAIDELSPQAQYVLLISIANHLREAVDEGHY